MATFIESLVELVRLLPQLRELVTRQPAIQEAIITASNDPTGFRRIRVTREAQGGRSQSDWIPCGRASSFTDEPIPEPGTQCLIALVNGDPHKPYFLRTLSNATNPPDTGQLEPTKDNTTRIPGNDRQLIGGDRFIAISGEQSEETGGDCYLVVKGKKYHISAEIGDVIISAMGVGVGEILMEADQRVRFEQGGAYAQMQGGFWQFANADGQRWTMGGSGDGAWQFDLQGEALHIVNAGDVTINGKSIIVVGSQDTDNDTNNDRGY